jgi:hypothetical protein
MELIRTADAGVVLKTWYEHSKTEGKPPPAGLRLSNLDSSVAKEGWLRRKENGPVPLLGAAGVVVSSNRLSNAFGGLCKKVSVKRSRTG